MSEAGHRLSRRDVLKLSLASAAAVSLPGVAAGLARANEEPRAGRSVSRTTGTPRSVLPSICHGCSARCGLLGFTEDGLLATVEGNPADPNSGGGLCARGHAGMNYVYSPDRLVFPMRKEGARRGGKLVQVSWDEALSELAERIRGLSRPEGLAILLGTLSQRGLVARFAAACGTPHLYMDELLYNGNALAARLLTEGSALGVPDLANTKYILNFGANPYESHTAFVPFVRRLVEARMHGARLVTLDPRLSNTAGRSDRWLPLRPGTDASVALAMAAIIVERGLHDQGFLREWTDLTSASLSELLAGHDVATAAEVSGLEAATIEQVAMEFATTKPACAIAGDGVSKRANGVLGERAVALLNALTGNVGVRGGLCRGAVYGLRDLDPAPADAGYGVWPVLEPSLLRQSNALAEMAAGRIDAEVLVVHKANPAYAYPNSSAVGSLLADRDRLPFVVCYDSFLTETAELADLVLPATTYLEAWDLDSVPALDRVPYVLLARPVSQPVGRAVDAPEVYAELAKRIGRQVAGYFPFASGEQYVENLLKQLSGVAGEKDLSELRTRGVWRHPEGELPHHFFVEDGFGTPSGKVELSHDSLRRRGLALPDSDPPPPVEGEFHLIVFQMNVHHRGDTGASKWLNEIAHDNPLWINAAVAQRLGLHDGDRVRVVSPVGWLETRVRLTNGIRSDTVALADGVGHWAVSRTARALRFASGDPDTNLVWWSRRGNGTAVSRVLQEHADPIGGGAAWLDTRVTLEVLGRQGG